MNRLVHAAARCAAGAFLLALLVGVPMGLILLVGAPYPSGMQLRDAWETGAVDDDTVVRVGAALFLTLWAWFAVTAIGEAARVTRWRTTGRPIAFEVPPPSPSGLIQRLVRLALISSTALASTTFRGGGSSARAELLVRPPAAAVAAPTGDHLDTAARYVSNGRDTPYSIASRLGDSSMRERLIELNRGRSTPSGAPWIGGVFPAGMDVALPPGSVFGQTFTWSIYVVEPGDSVFAIAAELVADDERRVVDVADQIIQRNLGRTMVDGRVFHDPSLILPGWQLEVPMVSTPAPDDAIAMEEYIVVAGDSYWRIAEDHLRASGAAPSPSDVAALTTSLRDLNAPRLGHDDPSMLYPGEIVRFPPIVEIPAVDAPTEAAPTPDAAPATPEAAPATPDVPAPPSTGSAANEAPSPPTPPAGAPVTSLPASVPPATVAIVPSSAAPPPLAAPSAQSATTTSADGADDLPHRASKAPIAYGLASAILLSAGALSVLEARRRHQLRRAVVGARLEQPTASDIETETLLRSLDAPERALRLDLALRSAAHHLAPLGRYVVAALLADDGALTAMLDAPAPAPASPWAVDAVHGGWSLPASVTTMELASSARRSGQPCPALVHLGCTAGAHAQQLFVDLEAIGLLCLDGPPAVTAALHHALAATLAASPLGETLHVITTGIELATHLGNLNAESAESLDVAIDLAATTLGSTSAALDGRRTFEARASAVGGEAWEPAVIIAGGQDPDPDLACQLVALTAEGGRGLAVVIDRMVDGARWVLRASDHDTWTLEPLGLQVVPAGISFAELRAVHDLLDAADRPARIEPHTVTPADVDAAAADFVEQPWSLMVRVLGQVDVVDRNGNVVDFERGKALELAVWLSQHRQRPTRAAARTALWDLDVRDATFANVVSDARRAMARAVTPPEGGEWIERTLTEQLPLHAHVASDAELLRARVEFARRVGVLDAIAILRPGLELVADMPFAGTGYLWPDAEGITSSLTLLATGAATELARHYLALGDVDGVFWATGQGLKVLYGHEELIALRIRAHAHLGDLAGVRNEWEVYERALTADPWSNGEPSPKLVAIRRELLSAG